LKSVYVSEKIKIEKDNFNAADDIEEVIEQEVFAASYTNPEPTVLIADVKARSKSWPLLGEDQQEKPLDERTMGYADTGLIVSSPLLFLKDGKRTISVRFYLEGKSFSIFKNYLASYAIVSDKNEKVSEYEILKNAFTISITCTEKWMDIKDYECVCDVDKHNEKYFQISFEIDEKAPAIEIYNPLFHGVGYDEKWPLLKLLLNNRSFYHPYVFLSI